MALKDYKENQKEKISPSLPMTPSGIECTNITCSGELMYVEPRRMHPELKELARTICEKCGWMGWC